MAAKTLFICFCLYRVTSQISHYFTCFIHSFIFAYFLTFCPVLLPFYFYMLLICNLKRRLLFTSLFCLPMNFFLPDFFPILLNFLIVKIKFIFRIFIFSILSFCYLLFFSFTFLSLSFSAILFLFSN